MFRARWFGLSVLIVVLVLLMSSSWAQTCEVCNYRGNPRQIWTQSATCVPAALGETGQEGCSVEWGPFGLTTNCQFSGPFCEEIIVIGGGGGGGGGTGGSSPCVTNGFCPLACFSCSPGPLF